MAGEWTAGVVDAVNGRDPPTVEEWEPVTVPGRPGAFADADGPIAYRTTFPDPRGHPAERTRVRLRGAFGRTGVWVNGTYLGDHEPYFAPAHLEFEADAENDLLVVCDPSTDASGWYGTGNVPADLATPGIWWGVEVQVRPETFVDSLEAVPREADDGWVIECAVTIDAGEDVDDAVTFSLRPEGFRGGGSMERAAVTAEAGARVTITRSIHVRDPRLWWPTGLGPQHRYTVRAKLGEDAIERTVGLRRLEHDDEGLVVNGRRLRARGVGRLPGDDERADVERAAEANANLVRARGHVPSRAFYDACDDAGLLVWQDLPVGEPFDADVATRLLESLESVYGSHPSLALYGVLSDPADPFETPLGTGRLSRLAFRWRTWRASVDSGDAESVAAAAPEGRPVVPVSGPPGTGADAAHLYPGWRYLEAADVEWLLNRYPSLASAVGAFGAGSLAADADVDPSAVAGLDADALGRWGDAAESPARQARTVKTVAEAFRRRGCGIVVAEALRDVAPGGGMGLLERGGTTKPAYDALAEAYEPVQALLEKPPAPGTSDVGIVLVNDTAERVEATVSWRAGEVTGEATVVVDGFESAGVGTLDVPADATAVTLECALESGAVRNSYSL